MAGDTLRRNSRNITGCIIATLMVAAVSPVAAATTDEPAAPATLHDQFDSQATTSTRSQNFDSVSDAYDDEAADDFEVPEGETWSIGQIDVAGTYSGTALPTGVNVRIYREDEDAAAPSTLVAERLNLQPVGGFASPNFSLRLEQLPPLSSGFYWVSVQANLVSGSHWFWTNRSTVSGETAVYRNPGMGWETDCAEWDSRDEVCAPTAGLSATDPDQIFRLVTGAAPKTYRRAISIRFTDGTGARANGLVVFGRLRVTEEGAPQACIIQQPVRIQREEGAEWKTLKTTNTNRRGRFAVEIADKPGNYRVVAPTTELFDEDTASQKGCAEVQRSKTHRHA